METWLDKSPLNLLFCFSGFCLLLSLDFCGASFSNQCFRKDFDWMVVSLFQLIKLQVLIMHNSMVENKEHRAKHRELNSRRINKHIQQTYFH